MKETQQKDIKNGQKNGKRILKRKEDCQGPPNLLPVLRDLQERGCG